MKIVTIKINNDRLIHSIKTAIAALIGILFLHYFNFTVQQWVVISIFVVMCSYNTVGGLARRSLMRFIGTLLGVLFCVLIIICGIKAWWAIAAALFFSALIFTYQAGAEGDISYIGLLGAVTTAIILLAPNVTYEIALERFIEISIGIVIALLVSRLIFPMYAKHQFIKHLGILMDHIRLFYGHVTNITETTQKPDSIAAIESIVAEIALLRKYLKEAKAEIKSPEIFKHYQQALDEIRQLFHAVSLMGSMKESNLFDLSRFIELKGLIVEFNLQATKLFFEIAHYLQGKNPKQPKTLLEPAAEALKKAIGKNLEATNQKSNENGSLYFYQHWVAHVLTETQHFIETCIELKK